MGDSEQVKAALAALVDADRREMAEDDPTEQSGVASKSGSSEVTDYSAIIERASRATTDLEAAAQFVESVGVDRLETAVERAEREVSGLAAEGREALCAFERFREAAHSPESDR